MRRRCSSAGSLAGRSDQDRPHDRSDRGGLRSRPGRLLAGAVAAGTRHRGLCDPPDKLPYRASIAGRRRIGSIPSCSSEPFSAGCAASRAIAAWQRSRRLKRGRCQAAHKLLIIDELGYVPLSTTGAELLFEVFSQRYERGSILVTSNLPFDEWTGVFASERLTGALLDRLTHHVHILEMNGDSYRLKQSKQRQRQT